MGKAHVMMVPYPAQGHVIPMLELAHILARHHITVTFVNTEIIHDRIAKSSSGEEDGGRIRYVSVSDGLESWERDVPGKLIEKVWRDMPRKVEDLVREFNQEEEEEKVTCLVCDLNYGAMTEVAKKMGIQSAVFLPTMAAALVAAFNIPNMIEDGIIDNDGAPLHDNAFQFSASMPIMTATDLVWHRVKPEIAAVRKLIFDITRGNNTSIKSADWVLCNSIYELEPAAFTLAPQIVPIGPLLASNRQGNSAGHLWKQDTSSLEWLDQQPLCSVIFVAFGSTTIFTQSQFEELALGLERTHRPFLWAVRPDSGSEKLEFPEGFLDRVSSRARIVGWVPQQKVLSHPSIACFVCHCGWNSTMESLSSGVPILGWPYSADNFITRSYVCDILKVGIEFELDGSGTKEEFKRKVDMLLGDVVFKERALQLKEMMGSCTREGGSSYKNLRNFIGFIQEC